MLIPFHSNHTSPRTQRGLFVYMYPLLTMKRTPSILPHRTYLLSDTLGPLQSPCTADDHDVRICTDFGGFAWRQGEHLREINVNGRTGIAPHLLRLILSFHDRHRDLVENGDRTYTAVFLNQAERTEEHAHGTPFFVAETDANVRIVATPLEDLASIRNRIIALWELPNEGSGLFEAGEQFRSQFTPALLPRDHGTESLVARDPGIIPEGRNGALHFVYADAFLNMVSWQQHQEELRSRILERAGRSDPELGVRIGDREHQAVATTSLEAGKPGVLNIYANGDNIDLVGKWAPGYGNADRTRRSAYCLFDEPEEGYTPVNISF